VRFASLLSGGFTTMAIINPPEWKLANRTSVRCFVFLSVCQKSLHFDNQNRNLVFLISLTRKHLIIIIIIPRQKSKPIE
jgi:hypothetical protein